MYKHVRISCACARVYLCVYLYTRVSYVCICVYRGDRERFAPTAPLRLFFLSTSEQISTVTITDRFSLTTHVVNSFMAVPKNRAAPFFKF